MAFEKIYQDKEFSLFYIGERQDGQRFKGGHLYEVEPAGIATQENALIVEMSSPERLRGDRFLINFNPYLPVYCDSCALGDQGEPVYNPRGICVHCGGAEYWLKSTNSYGFLISEKGVLWHEAYLYHLINGEDWQANCLGYVPLYALTRVGLGYASIENCKPTAREW